jgi:hypothetical protein
MTGASAGGAASFRVLTGSPCPPPRAPLLSFPGSRPRAFSSWGRAPLAPSLRRGRRLGRPLAGSSAVLPRVSTAGAMDALASPLLRLGRHGRSRGVLRSRVCFAAGAPVLFRGRAPLARFLARRRTARRGQHSRQRPRRQAGHTLSTGVLGATSAVVSQVCGAPAGRAKSCPQSSTGCGSMRANPWRAALSMALTAASSRATPLSAVQSR